MRRQRNTQQMKEQGKNPPDLKNEEEIGSLSEKEFRIMIVKMIQNLGNRMEKIQEGPIRTKQGQGPRRTKEQTNSEEQHNK